jgi:hypothetical protein
MAAGWSAIRPEKAFQDSTSTCSHWKSAAFTLQSRPQFRIFVAYYRIMARGWTSKAVEEQMDTTESKEIESDLPQITPEQQQRQRELESLELSRSRVQQELAAATHPRYRTSLEAALGYLEGKIAAYE